MNDEHLGVSVTDVADTKQETRKDNNSKSTRDADSVLAVVRDPNHTLGKKFSLNTDGTVPKNLWKEVTNLFAAAMFWYGYGLKVIPVLPGSKRPALRWDPWLSGLNNQKIQQHWEKYPGHELGCIVGDGLIVFDADTLESVNALKEIEVLHDLTPKMVVKTAKGEHHYYRRALGTVAKSDSHDSEKYPERIDIKTGRALVVLPISTGKSLTSLEAGSKDELSEAPQVFIDSIYQHNGRTAPSEPVKFEKPQGTAIETGIYKFEMPLKTIDPDSGYDDWVRVGMAIFHETKGSEEGMALFDRWSSRGDKYKGLPEIEAKWRSFRLDIKNPVTVGTLFRMAAKAEEFEPCEYVQISQQKKNYLYYLQEMKDEDEE